MMGDEQLTDWQAALLKFFKRQVDDLTDESRREDARPRIEQELFAAQKELDDFVDKLKEQGVKIEHRRRSWLH